jgi:hypothetical protein
MELPECILSIFECLDHIGNKIVEVFQPYTEADQSIRDAARLANLFGSESSAIDA